MPKWIDRLTQGATAEPGRQHPKGHKARKKRERQNRKRGRRK